MDYATASLLVLTMCSSPDAGNQQAVYWCAEASKAKKIIERTCPATPNPDLCAAKFWKEREVYIITNSPDPTATAPVERKLPL